MRILFIGQCDDGSTSKMRYDFMRSYFNTNINLIDISLVLNNVNRFFRSVGWRYKFGPLIHRINNAITKYLLIENEKYDLIWIEKGVFLKYSTIRMIRDMADLMVHYTPDPAFLFHQSRLFNKSVAVYDYCVTTKQYELEIYKDRGCANLIYCTQGYDEFIHLPQCDFEEKIYDVCFIGHYEDNRAMIIQQLLDLGLRVCLAGIKWKKFVRKNRKNEGLFYFGKHITGLNYSKLISQSRIGLGLLSKWIPENHTTRNFEIPACGTAMILEKNSETMMFFEDHEVIFFRKDAEIILLVQKYLKDIEKLKCISDCGWKKVTTGNFSYNKILTNLFGQINI